MNLYIGPAIQFLPIVEVVQDEYCEEFNDFNSDVSADLMDDCNEVLVFLF